MFLYILIKLIHMILIYINHIIYPDKWENPPVNGDGLNPRDDRTENGFFTIVWSLRIFR